MEIHRGHKDLLSDEQEKRGGRGVKGVRKASERKGSLACTERDIRTFPGGQVWGRHHSRR